MDLRAPGERQLLVKSILLFFVLATAALGADLERFLASIADKEGGPKRGAHGETGLYQMMPKTRIDAGGDDKAAALRHLRWIEKRFAEHGIADNVFNLALAWNAGWDRVRTGSSPEISYAYATAVERIYAAKSEIVLRGEFRTRP
jgi:hypothetical protein